MSKNKIGKSLAIPFFDDHERFLSKVHIVNDCWVWGACKLKSGYGKFGIGDRSYLAHRVSYNIFKGKIGKKMVIDHACKNKSCVNPDHLREFTVKENTTINSNSVAAINAQKTHCIYGHEFTPENTVKVKKGKSCRTCDTIRTNQSARKRRRIKREMGLTWKPKTHCNNGHELKEGNIKMYKNSKGCYICYLARARRYYLKKRNRLNLLKTQER